ncbi:MAG: glycosyltransferase family 2 protein [Elusimicrobia bacterium]|nr:glycosyltransferase family 2 protein [Elusimicrobiota bacterium]
MPEQFDFSIVIPFYNEETGVRQVLKEMIDIIEPSGLSIEIIAVDNGSKDQTGKIIQEVILDRPFLKKIRVNVNEGYGWGQLNGMRRAQGRWIVMSHGDGQLQPRDLIKILQEVRTRNLTFAKGVRPVRTEGAWRRIVSSCYNIFFSVIFPGVNARDINSPPKVIERGLFEKLQLTSKDWFIDAEIIIKASRLGVAPVEFPIEIARRCAGESHVKISTIFEFLKNIALWLLTNGRPWMTNGW